MKFAFVAVLCGILAACSPATKVVTPAEIAAESQRLTTFLDAAFEEELQRRPEWMTRLGRKDRYGDLDDRSEGAQDAALEWRRKSVADMKAAFDYGKLDEEAKTSFDMWALALERDELSHRYRRNRYIFARGGSHTDLPNFLLNTHKVETAADMDAYVQRARKIAPAMDVLLERAQKGAQDGVRMPPFAYDEAIREMRAVITGQPFTDTGPDSPIWADAKTKIAALKAAGQLEDTKSDEHLIVVLNTKSEGTLMGLLKSALVDNVGPSYQRAIDWLETEKALAGSESKGAGALPDGPAYYSAALKLNTTTDMSADEIHALGLAEVARIRGEMELIKDKVGFKGTLEEFFQHMRTNPKFILPNTDAGRASYIKQAEDYLAGMKAKLPEYFGLLPKADLVVKRVEAFREQAGGAQHYMRGSLDGSRPGVFYAHLSDMAAMPTFQLEAVAYHEGLPGHHMQGTIAQELTGLPQFRTQYGYTAYSEGWGLYSEALAKEMGFYADPYSDFGRLSTEIWRAVRLVVDTGMHAKGWSEEKAVQYFLANSASAEGAVRSEIRRYLVNPGQATSYKVGMLKILALRDLARQELGDRFSYPGFHDVVLGGGALPMPVLEARVKRWIEAEKAKPVSSP